MPKEVIECIPVAVLIDGTTALSQRIRQLERHKNNSSDEQWKEQATMRQEQLRDFIKQIRRMEVCNFEDPRPERKG